MSNTIRLPTLLRITIALSYWLQARHLVQAANINLTVYDTDPAIQYQPADLWFASTALCSTCLNPGLPSSFHEGVNPLSLGPDTDDNATSTSVVPGSANTQNSNPTTSASTQPTTSVTAQPSPAVEPVIAATSTEDSAKPGESQRGKGKRSFRGPLVERMDVDDFSPNTTVTMSYNFTGSAVYLYATQPPTSVNVNETSSNMNITVFIDSVASPNLLATNRASTPLTGQLVFQKSGLAEGIHHLVVQLGDNSTFIFDHLVYTTASETSTTPQSSPSPMADKKAKNHDVATFAGAVGGSVGVLALFSLGLALSIIRRRQLAAKRERRDHESLHTDASDDSPEMAGPAPFVPRYFPDTVIPQDPPTYMAALATNHNTSTLLAVLPPAAFGATQRSYADIPPSTPPPPLEDTLLVPPPPFVPRAPIRPPPPPPADGEPDDADEGARAPSLAPVEPPAHAPPPADAALPHAVPTLERVPLLPPSAASTPAARTSTESEREPTDATHLHDPAS